jgi:hypothetical protein
MLSKVYVKTCVVYFFSKPRGKHSASFHLSHLFTVESVRVEAPWEVYSKEGKKETRVPVVSRKLGWSYFTVPQQIINENSLFPFDIC